jgi:tripartite motif-containing protein 71
MEASMHKARSFFVCARIFCLAVTLLCATRSVHAEGGYVYVTQWGTAGTGDGQFVNLEAVAVDGNGNVYVADGESGADGCRIQKFTATGGYITQWGDYLCPPGPGHFPGGASAVATDGFGNVYVADWGAHDNVDCFARVQKFTSTGAYIASGWGGGYYGGQVTLDRSGNVYFLHWVPSFSLELRVSTPGGATQTWTWQEGSGDGQFNEVQLEMGVAVDGSGNVYISDPGNGRIQEFSGTGTFVTKWGSPGTGDGQFNRPIGVATDAAGNVYVADWRNSRIQKFTGAGTFITKWGSPGSGNGEFGSPRGVAIDGSGHVYVADWGNYRIQKFAPDATPTRRETWGGVKSRYRPGSAAQDK